jgi:hypothetical protein
LIQQHAVVVRRELQSTDREAEGGSLGRAKLAVLEIEVVDNLSDACDCGVADAEADGERLEGAAIPLVPETRAEHVKGHRVAGGLGIGQEAKPRVRIDEPANEPRRRHPIDAGSRTRHPQTASVLSCVGSTAGGGVALSLRRGWTCGFEVGQQRHDVVAAGAAEEIDTLDGGKPLSIAGEIAAAAEGLLLRPAGALQPL